VTPGSSSVCLEAVELRVSLAGRNVLDGVSVDLRAGEVATLEGSSGSGKTTLLRVLAGLAPADAGTIRLLGVDAIAIAPASYRVRVAYVAQHPLMFDETVHANVAEGPRLRGQTVDAEVSATLLARVGLDGFGPRAARDLSVGEKQRVALARALANDPEVLLLDEPTSALDAASSFRVLALVRALAASGLAVFVVTHADADVAALGGARYRLHAGKLQAPQQPA
jgi:ABC-type multidrug transport system ATPase subunit